MRERREATAPVAFFSNGYGDHIINLPALRALASLFDGRLTLVCERGGRELFLSDVAARRVIEIAVRRARNSRRFSAADVAAQTGGACDLFLSLVPWQSDSLEALLSHLAPVESIGFDRTFSCSLPVDYSKNSVDLAFDVVRAVAPELNPEDFAAPPRFPASDEEFADRFFRAIPAKCRTLAVHLDTIPEKMWPLHKTRAALGLFMHRNPSVIILLVGGQKQRLEMQSRRLIECYGLSLGSSCALVARADLFMGIDSCMLHVADLARVPGVSIFGPTSPDEFGFRFGPHRHLRGHGSTERVEPEEVVIAMEELLDAVETGHVGKRSSNSAAVAP